MKNISLIFLFIISFYSSESQKLNGKYSDGFDFLIFKNDSVLFSLSEGSGFVYNSIGCGTYELIEDFILIKSSEHICFSDSYSSYDSNSDTIFIEIKNIFGDPVKCHVVCKEKDGFCSKIYYTNEFGQLGINEYEEIDSILIGSSSGNTDIKHIPGKSYRIIVTFGFVSENKLLGLKTEEMNEDMISLYYLGDDLFIGKNKIKSLEKIYRNRQRLNKKRNPMRLKTFLRQ